MGVSNTSNAPEILKLTPDWVAVNKPPGWLSIPSSKPDARSTLLHWLRKQFSEIQVCHRLDVDTSGVILFARTREAHKALCEAFTSRQIKKTYLCLASGRPPFPQFKIQKPIEGRASTSMISVKERFQGSFLAGVRPMTGRRHQIRIHLSGEGYPLLGDPSYQGPTTVPLEPGALKIDRVALHAQSLELPTGEKLEAPLPHDFSGWLTALRANKNP